MRFAKEGPQRYRATDPHRNIPFALDEAPVDKMVAGISFVLAMLLLFAMLWV